MILEFRAKTEPREREEATEIKVPKVCLARMEPMVCEVLKVTPALLDLLVVMDAWVRLGQWAPPAHRVPWWRVRRYQDLQVPMVSTEPQECQETLDLRERWVPEETRDHEEWLEKMDFRVRLVLRARRAELEMLGSLGSKVKRETRALVVSLDLRVSREPRDCPASLGSREYQDCLGTLGRQEERETRDLLGWMGRTEWMARLV